jgi:hypothetical protein
VTAVLDAIADRLRGEGGLLAAASAPRRAETPHGDAAGPRLALAVEAIREGYLLHHDRSRLLADAEDPDLALLAGDRLYALGLAELAALGDLGAVRAMADVIAHSAAAQAVGDVAAADEAWRVGMRALAADR